ncbi:helix-hairpin-helix domain-containing protein [Pseudobacillus sp. FSL P4-0506]|uniref:helix-hairpin-helix domain-containing protein n=1 Tax=Pseudobacillus sp. FSL P4-0506 TaxID=2921576 RepID=UPI0030F6FA16
MKKIEVYEKEVKTMDVKALISKYKMYLWAGGALVAFGLYQLTEEAPSPEEPIMKEMVPAEQKEVSSPPVPSQEQQEPSIVMVDMKGAVVAPGIYSLKSGERINDAVAKVGGFQKEADRTAINLAQKLQDEMVIYVPKIGEEPPEELAAVIPPQESAQGHSSDSSGSAVNINEASVEELQQLPGIGKAKAQAIIDYRETTGSFSKPEDLKNVSGIGEKTFEKMASLVVIQ